MKLAFSWDDGALEDRKLFELHEKYSIPGMFFVPTENREGREVLTPNIIREAESPYIQFGGHTAHHTYLTCIPLENVEEEVVSNQKYLEDVLGHTVTDFCLPGGKYNDDILQIVYRHYKTIRTADTMNFRYEGGALKPSIHFYPRGIKSLLGNAARNESWAQLLYVIFHSRDEYFQLLQGLLERERKKESSIVMIWGHSWELEKYGLWEKLEIFMKQAKTYGCSKYETLFQLRSSE